MLEGVVSRNKSEGYFSPTKTQYNFLSRGVNCGSGGRGQTNIILLSALGIVFKSGNSHA